LLCAAKNPADEKIDEKILAKIRITVYTYSCWRNQSALGPTARRGEEGRRLFETFRHNPLRELWTEADFLV
jgi:hypothetical protein